MNVEESNTFISAPHFSLAYASEQIKDVSCLLPLTAEPYEEKK